MNLPCAFKKCPGSLHFTLLRQIRIALEGSEKFLAKYSKIAPTPHQSLPVQTMTGLKHDYSPLFSTDNILKLTKKTIFCYSTVPSDNAYDADVLLVVYEFFKIFV